MRLREVSLLPMHFWMAQFSLLPSWNHHFWGRCVSKWAIYGISSEET